MYVIVSCIGQGGKAGAKLRGLDRRGQMRKKSWVSREKGRCEGQDLT